MSSRHRVPAPGPVPDTHQCVVELESTDVVGGDVCSSQGLGDLGHNATLIWGQRRALRSASTWHQHGASPSLCQQRLSRTHFLPRQFPPPAEGLVQRLLPPEPSDPLASNELSIQS